MRASRRRGRDSPVKMVKNSTGGAGWFRVFQGGAWVALGGSERGRSTVVMAEWKWHVESLMRPNCCGQRFGKRLHNLSSRAAHQIKVQFKFN